MEDIPAEISASCSPGYQSEDSGTGSSMVEVGTSSVKSPSLASEDNCASDHEDKVLFAELSSVKTDSLIDKDTDADLLNYLTKPTMSLSDNPQPKHLLNASNDKNIKKDDSELEVNTAIDFDIQDQDENQFDNVDNPSLVVNADGSDLNRLYQSVRNNAKNKNVVERKSGRVIKAVRLEQKQARETRSSRSKLAESRSTQKKVRPPSPDRGEASKRNAAAEQARLNRQKKKQYVSGLESQVENLGKENKRLKNENTALLKGKHTLDEEIAYLKSVIANQSALSDLLKNIPTTKGIRLSSSFSSNCKPASEDDHDGSNRPVKRARRFSKTSKGSGGVCLHVDKDSVSLEFCAKCADMSKGKKRDSH